MSILRTKHLALPSCYRLPSLLTTIDILFICTTFVYLPQPFSIRALLETQYSFTGPSPT